MLSHPKLTENISSPVGRFAYGRRGLLRSLLHLCPLLLFCLLMAGCGYGTGAGEPTILGDASITMKMKGVEQPTLYPWMGQIIRSTVRDEIGARKVATWVDDGDSDYTLQINVLSFTIRSSVENRNSATLLYDVTIRMQAIVYSGEDNSEVWRSSIVSYSDRYETYSERRAGEQLTLQAVRLLISEMRFTF